MHVAQRKRRITGTGGKDKTAVMGILERGGKVHTVVIEHRRKKALQAEVHAHVEAGAALYTDALLSYEGLEGKYAHQVIDHAVKYVDGQVHTPRWTSQNRQLIDTAKPAINWRQPRHIGFTSSAPRDANRCALWCASSAART